LVQNKPYSASQKLQILQSSLRGEAELQLNPDSQDAVLLPASQELIFFQRHRNFAYSSFTGFAIHPASQDTQLHPASQDIQ